MPEQDIKKLRPEERIRRLKELEQTKKKEIEEAHRLIKETEEELSGEQKRKEKVPIPEVAKEDMEGLSGEGRELLKVHKGLQERRTAGGGTAEESEESEAPVKTRGDRSLLEEAVRESGRAGELPPESRGVEYAAIPAGAPGAFGTAARSFYEMSMQELQDQVYRTTRAAEERGYATGEQVRLAHYALSEVEKRLEAAEEGHYSLTEEAARAASLTKQLSTHVQNLYKSRSMYNR